MVGVAGLDELALVVQPLQFARYGQRRRAAAEAELVQPRAGAHHDAEGARRDLDIKRALIAVIELVEILAVVADQPRQDVEPAGRAFGIGESGDAAFERERFQ